MCGLVGLAGEYNFHREKAFVEMLHIDVIRGPDSTGTAFVRRGEVKGEPSVVVVKDALPPSLLVDEKFKTQLRKPNLVLMGHNRMATRGSVTEKNAHPFQHNHITGAHNGTLFAAHHLEEAHKFDTDSEAIFYNIAKFGIGETWKKIDGPATLTWWDDKEKSLHFLSNGKRPLYFGLLEDQKSMFWSSEAWILRGCLKRNDIDIDRLVSPKENIMFTFKFGDKITVSSQELEPYKTKVHVINRTYGRGFSHDEYGLSEEHPWEGFGLPFFIDGEAVKKPVVRLSEIAKAVATQRASGTVQFHRVQRKAERKEKKEEGRIKAQLARGFRQDYEGEWLPMVAWTRRYQDCWYCGMPLEFDDLGIEYIDHKDAICGDCVPHHSHMKGDK